MNRTSRDRLVAVLDREFGHPGFSATAEVDPGLLTLAVEGVGTVKFPVSPAQARKLRGLGTPARYGRGEHTLTDVSVRDTWEVPKDKVGIRWDSAFAPVLDALREELGLPSSCALRAEFHSMLVYERGQFFLPHQDSEKDDAMVGTLVVALPSQYTGGELVIEKYGKKVECHGSMSELALAAFYADCRHEVKPVKTGNRITLTFNLILDGDTRQPSATAAVDDVARHLAGHFATPVARPYSMIPAAAPDRLVYLLDHQYTERGLSWDRLKGGDAARVAMLRTAAERNGCRVMLALTEIQETWDAYDDDVDTGDGDGDYELNSLIESSTRLVRWLAPGAKAEKITLDVDDTEICAGTANAELQPYDQEYEGYMGNYGNTLDRWYRRAALVVFPADREFANRAEASPAWAMTQIGKRARSGDLPGARADAAELAPFWAASVRQAPDPRSLGKALATAFVLDDPATASLLLEPFRAEDLQAAAGAPLARLAERYGALWARELLRGWFSGYASEPLAWYTTLPDVCAALNNAGSNSAVTALAVAELSWQRLLDEARRPLAANAPSRRHTALAELGEPLAAVLHAAERCRTTAVSEQIVRQLAELGEEATAWLVAALRAVPAVASDAQLPGGAFDAVAGQTAGRLEARLARPVRAADDWAITAPDDCVCVLCGTLNDFLSDPERRVHEWPLKEQDRSHVHARIDTAELPVSHVTRRQGRPYTLVLAKLESLFERERSARAQDEADLHWLRTTWSRPATGTATRTKQRSHSKS